MPEAIDQAIQDIASKHGVLLSKDDPILILHTMNERLLDENRKAQEKLLAEFKNEMQIISLQWQNEAKGKAEKILNAALVKGKEVIANLLQDSAKESIHAMKKTTSNEMEARHIMKKGNSVNLFMLLATMLVTFICFSILLYEST